jgi:CheY-like chemotaxis protein
MKTRSVVARSKQEYHPKALVVEHDPETIDQIAEVLVSLDHDYDTSCSQVEASRRIKANEYSYILMGIRIPARSRTGVPRVQNVKNLLENIHASRNGDSPPVIILSDCVAPNLDDAEEMMRLAMSLTAKGAADVIRKPFPSKGRTLDEAIKDVLLRTGRGVATIPIEGKAAACPAPPADGDVEPRKFNGGTLAFYPGRVDLCGETIAEESRRGYAWQILQTLRETNEAGKYVHLGSQRLAKSLTPEPAQNTLIRSISSLRRRISKVMHERLGLECGKEDVIAKDEQGYHLREWIVVEVRDDTGTLQARLCGEPPSPADGFMSAKQRWIMARLAEEGTLTRREVEEEFDISNRTAKRLLSDMTDAGLIEFDRTTHPGFYRLKEG